MQFVFVVMWLGTHDVLILIFFQANFENVVVEVTIDFFEDVVDEVGKVAGELDFG